MWKSELFVDRALDDGRFVVTNNSASDIPIGTVLTTLQSRLIDREGDAFRSMPLAEVEPVSLELLEVEVFRKPIQAVPKGFSAAVRLQGNGSERLVEHLASKSKSIQVFLSAGRDAA